ncbi:MAG: UDP-N-acetylmuramate dehydrogenase, partial [Patescibacteria group bacterium]
MPQFKENINLSSFTNYRIGGPATFFFEADSPEKVLWAVDAAKKRKTDFFVLGAGTNVLVSDEGFAGLVLKPKIDFVKTEGSILRAGAGALVSDVLSVAAKAGLSGLEWAGGLPGTLGGAIRGNAGAFKGEIKDVVREVESFDTKTLKFVVRTNTECKFSYRSSIFKEKGDEIILSATLLLAKGDPKKIKQAIEEKIAYRLARHPMEYPNVGSIFKNIPLTRIYADDTSNYAEAVRTFAFNFHGLQVPVKVDPFPVVPTAYLISESGLKGVS